MRKRKNYKLPPQPARLSDVVRPEDLVLNFLSVTGALEQNIDLSSLKGRPCLVADLAFAFRYHLADKSRHTRSNTRKHLGRFLQFLDQHDPARTLILSARDVDSSTLRSYVAWLDSSKMTKGSRAAVWVTLKVAMAWLQRHRPDLVQPELEFPFNPFPRRHLDASPRPALTRKVIEAVLEACRRDIEASWADFQRGRELIAAAAARVAAIGEPTLRDLSDLGILLALLVQRHAGLLPEDGDLLAGDVLSRRVRHVITGHGGAERVSRFLHVTPETIVPYMIAIGAQSFANPEALHDTRRDCASEDLLIARLVHVTWPKGRASRVQRRSFLRDRGMSVPNLIDRVLALTAPLVSHAALEDRDKLFLVVVRRGRRLSPNRVAPAPCRSDWVRRFVARHGLVDQQGKPLCLTLASLRPTGLTHAHARLGHDVGKTQALANHADLNQTKRYVSQPVIQAEQTGMIARLQGRFVEAVRGGGVPAEQGGQQAAAPEEEINARNATASGFICRDPLAGIAPGQRKGKLCTFWLGCFTCRNAVIPLEAETLARVLRTRQALVEARPRVALDRWQLLYAPQLEIIERDILPEFPADVHAAASAMVDRMPELPLVE
jgi:integrase